MEERLLEFITSRYAPALLVPLMLAIFLIRVRAWRVISTIYAFLHQLVSMPASILEIRAELQPNHGKSLRDAVAFLTEQTGICMVSIQVIQDQIGIAQSRTDATGNITWVNRHYIELTGKAPDSLTGNGWINVIHDADKHRVFTEWKDAIDQHREYHGSFRIMGVGDKIIQVEAHGYPIRNYAGEITNFSGYIIRSDQTRATLQSTLHELIDALNSYRTESSSRHENIRERLAKLEKEREKEKT